MREPSGRPKLELDMVVRPRGRYEWVVVRMSKEKALISIIGAHPFHRM